MVGRANMPAMPNTSLQHVGFLGMGVHPFPTWFYVTDTPLLALSLGLTTTHPNIVISRGAFLCIYMILTALPAPHQEALGLQILG